MTAWASAFVAIRGVGRSFEPGSLALGRLLIGSLALGGLLVARRRWVQPSLREWTLVVVCGLSWFAVYNVSLNAAEQRLDAVVGLVYLGLVPTAVAFSMWAYALSRTQAARLGVTTYLVPPMTIALAWPLLGEVPAPLALLGGLLALLGVALTRRPG
jgi:drug/metabolite transporter (DMT)-like permease